jgi:methionyl-tRNA formyltransferase
VKQDPTIVTKAPKLKKKDGLIDWSKAAEEVCRQVRAMQPWPTAYTFLHRPGKEPMRVILNKVSHSRVFPAHFGPGVGSFADASNAICILAGDSFHANTFVDVLELQPAGKKRMSAEEFLRGNPIVDDARFGPEVLS